MWGERGLVGRGRHGGGETARRVLKCVADGLRLRQLVLSTVPACRVRPKGSGLELIWGEWAAEIGSGCEVGAGAAGEGALGRLCSAARPHQRAWKQTFLLHTSGTLPPPSRAIKTGLHPGGWMLTGTPISLRGGREAGPVPKP